MMPPVPPTPNTSYWMSSLSPRPPWRRLRAASEYRTGGLWGCNGPNTAHCVHFPSVPYTLLSSMSLERISMRGRCLHYWLYIDTIARSRLAVYYVWRSGPYTAPCWCPGLYDALWIRHVFAVYFEWSTFILHYTRLRPGGGGSGWVACGLLFFFFSNCNIIYIITWRHFLNVFTG